MPAGRYRRQREYPQPPPPSKNSTTITINKVSTSLSFIWFLSQLCKEHVVCQAWSAKKAVVSPALSTDRWDKQENAVAYVESLDQKVEFDYATAANESTRSLTGECSLAPGCVDVYLNLTSHSFAGHVFRTEARSSAEILVQVEIEASLVS
jgi:hypothetical protein